MKIGKSFNLLTFEAYFFFIDNYKSCEDFNTLGLYRSLLEHETLSLEEKIAIRDYANKTFLKTFEFLQIKDPYTFFGVSTLDREMTKADEAQLWKDIIFNQQRILSDKRIRERNFGIYSKHDCGREDCMFNGLMTKKGSIFAWEHMHFPSDKTRYNCKVKSERRKIERKTENQLTDKEIRLNGDTA